MQVFAPTNPTPQPLQIGRGRHEPTQSSEIIDLIGTRDVFSARLKFDEFIFPFIFVGVVEINGKMISLGNTRLVFPWS